MSPDWSPSPTGIPFADLRDPQSQNLYRYGGNNPLRFRDLDGHWHQQCGGQTSSTDTETGAVTVAGNCQDVPDWWNYPGTLAHRVITRTSTGAQQAWRSTTKFASSPRGRLLGNSLKQRKRLVLAVLMRGVRVMYPDSVMWIHN